MPLIESMSSWVTWNSNFSCAAHIEDETAGSWAMGYAVYIVSSVVRTGLWRTLAEFVS